MKAATPRVAVSGLHRGENPQPGAGIIRSIRRQFPDATIVGLVYDALESGIYVNGGPDVVYTVPYPSAGAEAFLDLLVHGDMGVSDHGVPFPGRPQPGQCPS